MVMARDPTSDVPRNWYVRRGERRGDMKRTLRRMCLSHKLSDSFNYKRSTGKVPTEFRLARVSGGAKNAESQRCASGATFNGMPIARSNWN